jgi:hypothetical protein
MDAGYLRHSRFVRLREDKVLLLDIEKERELNRGV